MLTHGTITGYSTYGCHCPPCTQANRDYKRQWQRDSRAGRARMVDAEECREHLLLLHESGLPFAAIGALTGLSDMGLLKVARGASTRVTVNTADRIMSVALTDRAEGHLVPAAPVRRLLKALSKAGVSRQRIAAACRQKEITQMTGLSVEWRTFKRLATIYEHAARQGIVPASILEEVEA